MRLPNASITSGRNSAPVTQMAVAHELAEPPEVALHPVGDEDAGLAHHLHGGRGIRPER